MVSLYTSKLGSLEDFILLLQVFNSPLMRMDRSEGSLVITPTSDSLEQNLIPEPPGPDIRDSPTLLQTHSPVGAVAPSPSRYKI